MTDFAADWNSLGTAKGGAQAFQPQFMADVSASQADQPNRDAAAKRVIGRENNNFKGAIPTSAVIDYASDWNKLGTSTKAPETPAGAPETAPATQSTPETYKPPQRVDKEVVHALASGVGHTIAGGFSGLWALAKSGGDTEAAAAAVRAEQEKSYQAKGEPAKDVMGALSSNYNPLNWIPNASKAIAEKGAEKGLLRPSEAAAIEAAGSVAGPGALLKGMKGVQFFKRVETPKPRLTYAQAQEQMQAPVSPVQAHFENVKEARANGYVTTPRQTNPTGTVANIYEGASGSAKMEKLQSVKNQANTNRIIATEDLGLNPNEQITTKTLENIRAREGAAYQAVKDSGVTLKANEAYKTSVSELHGDIKDALPGVIKTAEVDDLMKALSVDEMSPKTAITTVKVLRADATKNIKAGYQSPEKEALGFAQRKAAAALDDLIESNLRDAGKGQLSDAYKAARVKIAKTHDIEAALNDATGNVDALTFAKMADKGKPLSGGMAKVAKFAKAFSGGARNIDNMKDAAGFSLADVVTGAVAGQFNPAGFAAVAARPAARSLALSKVGQKMFTPISKVGK